MLQSFRETKNNIIIKKNRSLRLESMFTNISQDNNRQIFRKYFKKHTNKLQSQNSWENSYMYKLFLFLILELDTCINSTFYLPEAQEIEVPRI